MASKRPLPRIVLLLCASSAAVEAAVDRSTRPPNIVFLIDESTDGRTYHPGSPAYMPNIRRLQARGAYFRNFLSNSPVCAPSRSSMWSGRHVHRIPHMSRGVHVNGAWNNAEGNPTGYAKGWTNMLGAANYSFNPGWGKTDWVTGQHALWNWLQCWTMYAPLPYHLTLPSNITAGAWSEQPNDGQGEGLGGTCRMDGVIDDTQKESSSDWNDVRKNVAWLRDDSPSGAKAKQPFLLYQGMNIVHPPYRTTRYWYDKIADYLPVPPWQPLEELHPCDLQTTMLKGCIPEPAQASHFYSLERRRRIRRIYLASIAEFDAMVGDIVDAVEAAGLTDNTVIIVTSDHGDMWMEHQQFYKMAPYDASVRVPLVVAGPGVAHAEHESLASLIDLYPTILELSGASRPEGVELDGKSLVPLLRLGDASADALSRRAVLSQGHMADNAISWYMVREGDMKLVVFGTGSENEPKLFNITADPDEWHNLAGDASYASSFKHLSQTLKGMIDYPAVSMDVANYNQQMFRWYMAGRDDWRTDLAAGPPNGLPGGMSGTAWRPGGVDVDQALQAVEKWIAAPAAVRPCRPFHWRPAAEDAEAPATELLV